MSKENKRRDTVTITLSNFNQSVISNKNSMKHIRKGSKGAFNPT